jgi:uncharacterized protein (AIM24 family)
MVIKKGTLICMQQGVRLSPHRKRGFISSLLWNDDIALQKLEGTGFAFIELDASAAEYVLSEGESMKFDRSAIAYMSSTCKVSIQKTNIIKSFFFGGDSIYQYTIMGPGKVTMQNFNRNRF